MIDREKVIKALEHCKDNQHVNDCYKCDYGGKSGMFCIKMIDDALALLKEQEAKPIVRKQCKKENDDGSIDYFAEWYCPHCNMLILRGFDNPSIKFCYKCGKPVLWENR